MLCRRTRLGIAQGSVGVSTVSHTQNHDFAILIVDSVRDSKRATSCGPETVEVAVQRCSNSARRIKQGARDQFDAG